MLDDLKLIHERDHDDLLGVAERQWKQLEQKFEVKHSGLKVENVVYAAMGGSGIAGMMAGSWPGVLCPFQILRNYDVPEYVSDKTLFIAASYSGNTEETISALLQAEKRGAFIAVITTGGKLAEIADKKDFPLILLPKGEHPRFATLYNFKALLVLLESADLIDSGSISKLERVTNFVQDCASTWSATVPTTSNFAKKLALEVIGKSVVIYSGPKLVPAAYKWKIGFNENAKQVAWYNAYPEFNHNEFTGWTKQPVNKPYAVIDLRSSFEHARNQVRFELSEQLLSGLRPAPLIVTAEGKTIFQQLLWTITLGDFVTLYTSLLSGVNPSPVPTVDKLKRALEHYV